MVTYLPQQLLNNQFLVTSRRGLYWENESILVLSDLHLGKGGHFRKSGIGIPQAVMVEDMQRLLAEIQFYKPSRLIIVGDLFHSTANKEHELFLKWRTDISHLHITLVKGNHDILPPEWYRQADIEVIHGSLSIGNFIFVHDLKDDLAGSNQYCFSGHIHPGITIKGRGKQALRLPCFYFGKNHAILPAFGKFTGTYSIEPGKGDIVFALAEDSVIKVNG